MRFGPAVATWALALLLLVSTLPAQIHQPSNLVITGGTVVDVRNGKTVADSVVIIERNHIKQVGKAGQVSIPAGAQTFDARSKWIIPGLADMHIHLTGDGPEPITAYLSLLIANGVTTIRDSGAALTPIRTAQQDVNSATKIGPRIFYTGEILDGNPPNAVDRLRFMIDSPKHAESAVNFLIDQGATWIKVYNTLTEESFGAIVDAAHARGIPVTGHIPVAITLTQAVDMGIDGMEHIRVMARDVLDSEDAAEIDKLPIARRMATFWPRVDVRSDKSKRLIALLATRKVFVTPTLLIHAIDPVGDHKQDLANPNNRFIPRSVMEMWGAEQIPANRIVPPEMRTAAAEGIKRAKEFVVACARAGVPILAGSDGTYPGKLLPGFGLHNELQLLVEAGLTPLQSLQAATITAARALRKEDELGNIEAGKLADLVILDANPLMDINNTKKINAVVANGRLFDRRTLDELLSQLEADGKK